LVPPGFRVLEKLLPLRAFPADARHFNKRVILLGFLDWCRGLPRYFGFFRLRRFRFGLGLRWGLYRLLIR
jgi:hypothetical protein